MGDTASTESTVGRYFRAWTDGDGDTVRELLAEDFRFTGLGMQVEGRDAFLAAGAFPADARTTLLAQACQGSSAFQMYDSSRPGASVRIVEHLRVEGGKITSSTFITDAAAFMAFRAGA
jgi:ketosteroid isomerase-like protein